MTRWHDNDQTWARYKYNAQGQLITVTGRG
ncbi:hypothetical protein D5072_22250, partial [Dickeya dianthicola]